VSTLVRRRGNSVTDLLNGIAEDIKDFLDDEVVERGRDTERDLRRAGRNLTDSPSERRSGARDEEIDELRLALKALSAKIDQLSSTTKT
jgi:hypothetical protein